MQSRARAVVAALAMVCAVAGAATVAHAQLLTVGSAGLGAGATTVGSCGSLAGIGYTVVDSSGSVTSVTVSGIPGSCNGASLKLALTNAGVSQGEGGPVPVTNGAATVAVSPPVPVGGFDDIALIVTGP